MAIDATFELVSPRCVLRPMLPLDAAELHALWTSPGVRRFLWDDEIIPDTRTAEVIAASQELFREHRFGLWAVRLTGAPEIAGFAGIWPFRDPPEFELLYGIAEPLWGQGLAVEASRAVLAHCYVTLGQAVVHASTDAANIGSVRVLEKLGFRLVRRARVSGLDTVFFERLR